MRMLHKDIDFDVVARQSRFSRGPTNRIIQHDWKKSQGTMEARKTRQQGHLESISCSFIGLGFNRDAIRGKGGVDPLSLCLTSNPVGNVEQEALLSLLRLLSQIWGGGDPSLNVSRPQSGANSISKRKEDGCYWDQLQPNRYKSEAVLKESSQ